MPVPLKILATTSIDGNMTSKKDIQRVKYFSNLFMYDE